VSRRRRSTASRAISAQAAASSAGAPRNKEAFRWWGVGLAVGLAALTIVAYAPVRHHESIDLDDPGYVFDNPHVAGGLTSSGVAWAFTTGHAGNWHPLTWISHMMDASLFGLDPGAHHLVNLVFHVANTLLLFAVLAWLTGSLYPSAFVAAVFGLHPTHVESVAWIAERKDVLSTFFWLLTMGAWGWYVRRPTGSGWGRYAIVGVVLALGLMSKPMLVTLPFVLILLDYWPLRRTLPLRSLVLEKLPLFALVVASSIVTFIVQRQGGAMSTLDVMPMSLRIGNALVAYVTYLWKIVWPMNLGVFYPFPTQIAPAAVAGAGLLLAALTVVAVRAQRTRPWVFMGWLWYLGTLVPVIGLVQVGTQALADRYMYVPLIGLTIAVAWSAADAPARFRAGLAGAGVLIVLALTVATRAQLAYWQNSLMLWQRTVDVTTDNYRARNSLGAQLGNQGRPSEAIVQFTEALRLAPDRGEAFHIQHNLGRALADLGRFEEAIPHYREALRLKPDYPEAHNNLGLALGRTGHPEEALAEYRLALEDRPGFAPALSNLAGAHNDLGFSLFSRGLTTDAIREYSEALQLRPDFALALDNRGFALAASGNMAAAVSDFRRAIAVDPKLEPAYHHLGLALAAVGQFAEAERHLISAIQLNAANEGARRALERVQQRLKEKGK
jgi:tetratricopeptide (TPR) repeat protein